MTVSIANNSNSNRQVAKPTTDANIGSGLATAEAMRAEIERLRAENAALAQRAERKVAIKLSGKGAVSLYGLGRFPVTLYVEGWELLAKLIPDVLAFIAANSKSLKRKDEDEAGWAMRTSTNPVAVEARKRAADAESKRNAA